MPDPSAAPYVFLSYTSAHRERVLALADTLAAAGVGVWVDRRDIAGGSSWDTSIVDAIRDCTVFALTCSARSLASPNVQQEVRLAWEEQRPILPLLLEHVPIPRELRYPLAGRQWVELLDRPEEAWLPDVLRALAGFGIAGKALEAATTGDDSAPIATHAGSRRAPRIGGQRAESSAAHAAPIASSLLSGPGTSPQSSSNNLPTPLTSFLGRELELADIVALFEQSRLLTLTGPGGTGKTRLAIATAHRVADSYSDGARFVDLSGVSDAAGLIPAIAQVLGVVESEGRSLAVSLAAYLRHKRLLLVLDNFEQVVEAALQVHDLLVEAPNLTVLVTSRVLLRVGGEQEYAVPPLPLPDAQRDVSVLGQNVAVLLFVERARALRPDLALTPETAIAIAEICRRLDGLPLAIELAAARVKLLPPAALLARLERTLPLLTGGVRTLPQRQQTLRATIAWSWDLLSEPEQVLFRRLGIFAGGWRLEAAEAVCNPDGELDVLTGLESLVDKSLVRQSEVNGEPRFTMLATLREFALEQLEAAGESEALGRQHATSYCALAERSLAAFWHTGHMQDSFRELDPERDNLRAALQWALEHRAAEVGLRLVAGLEHWLYVRVPGEGRRWADALLSLPGAAEFPLARGITLVAAAVCAWAQGEAQAAVQYSEAAIHPLRAAEDLPWLSVGLAVLSFFLPASEAVRARTLADEAVTVARATGERYTLAYAGACASAAPLNQGDLAGARLHLEEVRRLTRALGADWLTMTCSIFLGLVGELQGQRKEARRLWLEARPLAEALNDRVYRAQICIQLALLASTEADDAAAIMEWRHGLALARDLGSTTYTAICLAGLTGVLANRGGPEAAVRLLAAVEGVQRDGAMLGFERSWFDSAYAGAEAVTRAALSPEAFEQAWAEGEALSLDEAVTFALAALPSDTAADSTSA